MRGASTPTNLMFAPQINGFNAKLNERLPYDPEKAKALLAEAGYAEGFTVTLDCPNDRYVNDERICQAVARSEEHTSELQSLMRISYAVFCLNKKNIQHN